MGIQQLLLNSAPPLTVGFLNISYSTTTVLRADSGISSFSFITAAGIVASSCSDTAGGAYTRADVVAVAATGTVAFALQQYSSAVANTILYSAYMQSATAVIGLYSSTGVGWLFVRSTSAGAANVRAFAAAQGVTAPSYFGSSSGTLAVVWRPTALKAIVGVLSSTLVPSWWREITPVTTSWYFIPMEVAANPSYTALGASCDVSVVGYHVPCLLLFGASGSLLWSYGFGPTAGGVSSYDTSATAMDASNNVYTAVNVVGVLYILKYAVSGVSAWVRSLSCPSFTLPGMQPQSSFCDAGGNFWICGRVGSTTLLFKMSPTGTLLLSRQINAAVFIGYDSVLNQLVCSTTLLSSTSSKGAVVFRLPVDGSRTGTYTLDNFSFTYATLTASVATTTLNAFNLSTYITVTTPTVTTTTPAVTTTAPALTHAQTFAS